MHDAEEGRIKALFVMGENPALTDPNLNRSIHALKSLEFLAVQDIFLTETARFAHVVLPGVSFAEKDGTFTNTERRVQRVRKAVDAPGQARQDWEILCDLSTRLGWPMSYAGPEAIFEEMAALTPSYSGITYDRIEENGIQWPCPTKDHPGTKLLHKDRFTRGPGLFHAIPYIPAAELPDEGFPYILTTGRYLEQYHTGTMTRHAGGLDELRPAGAFDMNPADAEKEGIGEGDRVRIASRRGELEANAHLTSDVAPGTVFLSFHFHEAAANLLTNDALDPVAKIPEYKVCAVRMERVGRA
jgi:predicted molibdopterin-dependent oxidoreductase YjgC